ncbi:metalloregulator ArsR/SmtB family transcription factor [Propioniciclava soli]|uniref:Metalloregulator ArsR/SmtB family transcription factor n=1 Tax=Propioniciclava soli TaxID=2775081 RepID=A0ABZ3C681_9ACTN|nr:metalloregulator ArsR/SmtB family transcription factor [Propioniciclava soli]
MDLDARVHLLKTIADATRLRILGLLAEEPRSGRQLAEALGLGAPTISHHMARLVEVGIVRVTPDGTRRLYALNAGLLDAAAAPAATATVAPIADPDHARHVRIFFDGPRLRSIPAKRKARVSVLLELLRRFEPGRRYAEAEVNALLREAHDDVAFLRRELVDYRYLAREGGVYWVNPDVPDRDANEAQEVPAGEAAWLGQLVRGVVAG